MVAAAGVCSVQMLKPTLLRVDIQHASALAVYDFPSIYLIF
jgi:hypothetical protein